MTRIQVHPDELEKNARLLQQSKQQLGKIVYELDKTMYFLQSEWSGVTSEKFFWDFMNIKESVFPSTLGLLDIFQDKIQQTLSAFKKADNSGGEMLQIPDKLEPNFATGLIDKAIGDAVTGVGETVEALFYNPFSTLGSLAYDLTVGKIVDVGRGLGFAWDTAWGTGTARSDIEQFVSEQKKQLSEDESGYYKGAVIGQALSYFLFGKALHSKDHHGSGGASGSGEGKKGPEKESGNEIRDKGVKEPVVTKTHRGLEYEIENASGSTLNWIEQNPKNISNAITIAKNSNNLGTAIEGKVGEFVNSRTEVTHFGVKVENTTTGQRAGDIDIATATQFIEVKKSTNVLKKDQIIKYTDSNDPNYFNYQNKEVIIYIDEPINMSNPRVEKLIKSVEEIPGVNIVNSLDELGKVLK